MRCGTPVTYSVSAANGEWVQITAIAYGPEVVGPSAAGEYVAMLPSEVADTGNPILNLSPEAGMNIAAAIVACWSVGLVVRLIERAINFDGNPNYEKEN